MKERSILAESKASDLLQVLDERLRALVNEAVEARLADLREWVDQYSSPLPRKTFLTLVRKGHLEASRIGKRVLVRRTDLDAYIASHRVQPAALPANDADEVDALLAARGYAPTVRSAGSTR